MLKRNLTSDSGSDARDHAAAIDAGERLDVSERLLNLREMTHWGFWLAVRASAHALTSSGMAYPPEGDAPSSPSRPLRMTSRPSSNASSPLKPSLAT